jgi:hypothetical protein
MNITRALTGPFSLLKTAVRSHMAGQRTQAAASAAKAANCFLLPIFLFKKTIDFSPQFE